MEKDLLISTGFTLDDIGRALPWSALGAFLHRLDLNSEVVRELDPELAQWGGTIKTNAILADIFDMLAMINANLCAMGSGKRAKTPPKYPKPGEKNKKRIGKNAMPMQDLEEWFRKKREERSKK